MKLFEADKARVKRFDFNRYETWPQSVTRTHTRAHTLPLLVGRCRDVECFLGQSTPSSHQDFKQLTVLVAITCLATHILYNLGAMF